MSVRTYSLAIITGLTFFSCAQKYKADEVDESLFGPAPVKAAQPVAMDTANVKTIAMPQSITPAATGNPAAGRTGLIQQNIPGQPVAQPNTSGLNPAHGQPGHRCDINVGAPLNSKPVVQNAAPVAVNSSPAPNITAVAAQATAPGMNPPHGQPGHRCDISVGAPLNSKPVPAATPSPIAVTPAVVNDSAKH